MTSIVEERSSCVIKPERIGGVSRRDHPHARLHLGPTLHLVGLVVSGPTPAAHPGPAPLDTTPQWTTPREEWELYADEILAESAQAGEPDAFTVLWGRNEDAVHTILNSIESTLVSEDVLHAVRSRLKAQVESGCHLPVFRMQLRQVIRDVVLEFLEQMDTLTTPDPHLWWTRPVSAKVREAWERSTTVLSFHRMDPLWQQVVWLAHVEALDHETVARHMGMPVEDVDAMVISSLGQHRRVWIDTYTVSPRVPTECRAALGGAAATDKRTHRSSGIHHLRSCFRCNLVHAKVGQLERHMPDMLWPLVLC